jgi:hypothetical protein
MSCKKKPFYLAVHEEDLDSCYKQHQTEAAALKEADKAFEDGDSGPVLIVRVVGIARRKATHEYCKLGGK